MRYIFNKKKISGNRIKSIDILLPLIRSKFYVRLFSVLGFEPTITEEGYEFYIIDSKSGTEFSAGLTGFGPGYFCKDDSNEAIDIITEFDELIFSYDLELKECKIEIETDFGTSTFGYNGNELIEIDEG